MIIRVHSSNYQKVIPMKDAIKYLKEAVVKSYSSAARRLST